MSQTLILKNRGLFTNSNQLSEVPEGGLVQASNCVIDKDSVIESRRGFERLDDAPASDLVRNDRLTTYQDHVIARRSSDDTLAYYVDGSGWTNYAGTYLHPDANYARIEFLPSNGNLYFTTSLGVKVLDVYTGPVYSTGMPRGLDGVAVTTGASGFMTNNTQVAYRVVWGSRDTNNNLYLSAPSQRIICVNSSGGTRDVSLTFTIPSGITTSDFFQVYRSKESAGVSDEPNDELQLVYEANPTSGEITALQVTFTDSTPTSLMGASLYTNSSQEGISESNDEPPYSQSIALFKNFTFFSNIKTKHFIDINLLAIGGASGLVLNDTITINSMVFTAKAATTVASREFQLFTGGSASQNIDDTARELIKVINQYASNTTVYAYYESGYQDLAGQILIIKRVLDNTSFTVTASRATAWDLGTGTSSNDEFINGLMWSKNQQPEHVPTSHLEYIGSKNFPIRKIITLRDSLFILKDDGVFRLTGSAGSWSIDPLDTSTKIIAPDSASVVNNQIYALCDQGIVSISDIGVQVISRPIENQIQDLMSVSLENLKKLSFGVAYETDRKYLLWTISELSDTAPSQAFVYNTFTQSWTTWVKGAKHAINNSTDDKLYLCNSSDKHILKERKSLTFADYIDDNVDGISITAFSGYDITVNTITGLDVGYLVYENSTTYSVIESINTSTLTLTLRDEKTWSIAAVDVFKSINCTFEYIPQHFNNAGIMKHFQEISVFFRDVSFSNCYVSFFTDLSGGYQRVMLEGSFGSNLWGLFPWGNGTWGGISRPKPLRAFVPREKSRGTLLSLKIEFNQGYAKWSVNGVSVNYDWVSERTTRS